MNKKIISLILMFILVSSGLVIAEDTAVEETCAGFWGSISCFLFGDADARATGSGWFDRGGIA